MNPAKTPVEAHELIEQAGEKNTDAVRYLESIAVGKAIRQGDLYVRRIASLPDVTGETTTDRQLAPGNTRGSRHMLEGDAEVVRPAGKEPLRGPYFVAKARVRITHPEHAHFSLPPGTYEVIFQRDFDREQIARVMD